MRNRFYSFEEKARNRRILYGVFAGVVVVVVTASLMHGVPL